MLFTVNFTDNITLIYNVMDEPVTKEWRRLLSFRNPSELCDINSYSGYASDEKILSRFARLYELRDQINQHIDDKITITEITKENWKEILNKIHIHFPELMNDSDFEFLKPTLTEYNAIIHWLETVLLASWSDNSVFSETSIFRITLDLNTIQNSPKRDLRSEIPVDAYRYFTPFLKFGDLALHYAQVGKHAYEIYINNDLKCPVDQFVPQSELSASVRMYFFDDFWPTDADRNRLLSKWKKFYDTIGGYNYWKIEHNDSTIRFGYLKIGELQSIIVNREVIAFPQTKTEMSQFRKKLANTSVLSWSLD